jgi:predicted nucleotidyltransferase
LPFAYGFMDLDYQTIFKELNQLKIDYLVVGGLAVNFHGIPRMTYDIDLMILLEPKNILKLVSKLTEWGYRPKVPVDPRDLADEAKRNSWIQDKGMKALNFFSETLPIGEIDLVFDSPIPYDALKVRAIMAELQEEKIPTISIHDLIELKLQAGRKQDLADVEHLQLILEK